jgi:hypothetical protein
MAEFRMPPQAFYTQFSIDEFMEQTVLPFSYDETSGVLRVPTINGTYVYRKCETEGLVEFDFFEPSLWRE